MLFFAINILFKKSILKKMILHGKYLFNVFYVKPFYIYVIFNNYYIWIFIIVSYYNLFFLNSSNFYLDTF